MGDMAIAVDTIRYDTTRYDTIQYSTDNDNDSDMIKIQHADKSASQSDNSRPLWRLSRLRSCPVDVALAGDATSHHETRRVR